MTSLVWLFCAVISLSCLFETTVYGHETGMNNRRNIDGILFVKKNIKIVSHWSSS